MQQSIHPEGIAHHGQPPGVRPGLQVIPVSENAQYFRGKALGMSGSTIPLTHAASKAADQNAPFNWTKVDGIKVPYIMRGNVKFVSVKMVESKLLSRFPKITMDNMGNVGPIYSYYVTEAEAKLLTNINAQCYHYAFGNKAFTTKDLIVSLSDFENFYNRARQHFLSKSNPAESKVPISQPVDNAPTTRTDGGWVQINNTVVPYVLRNGVKFVPLSVIKYAAGLLTDVRMDGYRIAVLEAEYNYLNIACQAAGVNFTFSVKTKLIKLELVIRMSHSKVVIQELPSQDPFNHAQYSEGAPIQNQSGGLQPEQMNVQMKCQQMPPRNPFVHQSIAPGQQPFTTRAPVHFPNPQAIPVVPRAHSRPQVPFIPRDQQTPSPTISPRVTPASIANKSESVSSATSSRPSSVQSRSSITPPPAPSPKAMIKSLQFEGKTVSCLMRDGEKDPYALLEALVRLYFPLCSLNDFQSALEQVLNIPVYQLTNEEEAEFIKFYGLRVKSLRCKSIVSFEEFQSNHGQLKYIFSSSDAPKAIVEPQTSQEASTMEKESEKLENNNNNASGTKSADVLGDDKNLSSQGAQKRKSGAVSQNKKAKQPCKRLEDTVAMLKMRKETPTGEEGDTE